MKLIVIYGPPAAGKLTVARELARITGYKLFHNQLTVDLVISLFDRGTKQFDYYINKYRYELLEAAAKNKVNCIFTFVYAKDEDDKIVSKFIRIIEKHKGKLCFVNLYCHKKTLRQRVKDDSRKMHRKIRDIKTLNHILNRYELFHPIPHRKSLIIDNTHISAKKVAKMIKRHYKL